MICDRCGSQTTPKQITSKKNGQTYTVFECNGSCMNGNFKYSMFAPRPPKAAPRSQTFNSIPVASQANSDTARILNAILEKLTAIHAIMNAKNALKNDPLEVVAEEDQTPF